MTDGGTNTVTPIDIATNTPRTPITVGPNPFGIAITPEGSTAYVANATVTPIDTATNTAETPITVGASPGGIAITPNGATAYVANAGVNCSSNTVTPIDTATNTAGTSITVGGCPLFIAITPDGSTACVTDFEGHSVTPIDTATNTAGTAITVGDSPVGIAITPDQAPVAHFSVTPAEAGQPTGFDASASTVAVGTITTYAWDFGDGSTATTSAPTTSHTYATPGTFTATVTETDSAGTSTTQVFTGQTMSNDGGPSAVASQNFTVVPSLAITTSSVPPGTVGTKYSTTLQASGGNPPYKWSNIAGTLPTGLRLRRSTGVLIGKPTTTGTFTFTVQVVDRETTTKPHTENTATAIFSLTIT